MGVLAIGVKHALHVSVQCPQHADTRMHQWPTAFRRHNQRFGRGLPFPEVLFGLRQVHDVSGSVLQGDKLPPAGQRNGILERSLPALRVLTQRDQRQLA